jgi:hypothetical protein
MSVPTEQDYRASVRVLERVQRFDRLRSFDGHIDAKRKLAESCGDTSHAADYHEIDLVISTVRKLPLRFDDPQDVYEAVCTFQQFLWNKLYDLRAAVK